MMNLLKECCICPRNCGVDRTIGQTGYCGATEKIKVARTQLHFWEEPCISGVSKQQGKKYGSGTVFFSHCNMGCVFCQNHKISGGDLGIYLSENDLADQFLKLQSQNAANINLVTPTHYMPQIIKSIQIAKSKGLTIPIVYNSSGYETLNSLDYLKGYINIFMPDLKYYSDKLSQKYSSCNDYFKIASQAIEKMVSHVGKPVFDNDGFMVSGVIIRHLMLPSCLFDSKKIVDFVFDTFGNDVYFSLMNQFTPCENIKNNSNFHELNKKLNPSHYNTLVDYAVEKGFENCFIQDGETALESFIPDFSAGLL